jgi:hypothetical protein
LDSDDDVQHALALDSCLRLHIITPAQKLQQQKQEELWNIVNETRKKVDSVLKVVESSSFQLLLANTSASIKESEKANSKPSNEYANNAVPSNPPISTQNNYPVQNQPLPSAYSAQSQSGAAATNQNNYPVQNQPPNNAYPVPAPPNTLYTPPYPYQGQSQQNQNPPYSTYPGQQNPGQQNQQYPPNYYPPNSSPSATYSRPGTNNSTPYPPANSSYNNQLPPPTQFR